jgi:hypothetical protein
VARCILPLAFAPTTMGWRFRQEQSSAGPPFLSVFFLWVETRKQRAISIDYPRSGGAQVEIRRWGAIVGHGRSNRSWSAWNVGDALTTSGQPLFGFSCRPD